MADQGTIVEKLRILNVFPNSIDESVEIFTTAQNEEDVTQEVRKRQYSCGSEQFLYFHFGELVKLQPGILAEAEAKLGHLGLSSDYIREFFTSGADPSLVMSAKSQLREAEGKPANDKRYDRETRKKFSKEAYQFALNRMKEYLGIAETPKHK